MLAGTEALTTGEYKLGHNVEPDYFAQDQYKELDPESRMLDDLSTVAGHSTQTELRNLLGCFLFSEDDVFKRIGVLSAASATATRWPRCCCIRRTSCCSTSPPTTSTCAPRTCCSKRFEKFTGTVVFVSHDRYFIDKLATRIFEIGEGEVRIFPGNYEDYMWRKEGAPLDLSLDGAPAAPPAPTLADVPMPDQSKAKDKRLNPMKLQKLQDRAGELESEIERLEAEVATLETALSDFRSVEETMRTNETLEQRRKELSAAMEEWEQVSETIEANS